MPDQKKDSKKPFRIRNPFHGKHKKADSSDGRAPTKSARASPTLPGPSKAPPAAVEPPNDTGSVQLPKTVKPEVSTVSTDLPVLADSAPGEPAQPKSKPEDDYSTDKLLLWDEAYEALKTDDETKTLMATYEEFLADLGKGLVEDASLLDGKSGQEKMNMLLQGSLEKMGKLDKVEARIAPAIDIVLSVKTSIGAALSSIPIAAAVWAPICIILQLSSKSFTEGQENLNGIVEIVKKMKWYSGLSLLLLEDTFKEDARYKSLLTLLANEIRDLYKVLLLYIIETIHCHCHNPAYRILIRTVSDWKANMKRVTDAEDIVLRRTGQSRSQQTNTYLQLLLNLQLDERQRQLSSKLFVRDMDNEMASLQNRKDTLLPEACEWIINDDKYKNFLKWDERNSCRVLWIKGEAGMGKTMLVIGLIRELTGHFDLPYLSYFFCQGTDDKLNTATAILKGLMWMLMCQERQLFRVLDQEIERSGDQFLTEHNSFQQLAKVFTNMICDTALARAVLVVDALDECLEFKMSEPQAGLESLLQLIVDTVKRTDKVKWLLSGRNIDILSGALSSENTANEDQQSDVEKQPDDRGSSEGKQDSDMVHIQTYECLEVNRKSVKRALNLYIDGKVNELGAKYLRKPRDTAPQTKQIAFQKQSETLDQVAKKIREKTDGTFLWVALVFQELKACEPSKMLGRLEEIPSELKKLYARIIQRISESPYKDSYKRVITACVLASRPLRVDELMMLASAPLLANDGDFLENTGLLTVRNDIAYLLHQSTLNYLKNVRPDDAIRKLFPEGFKQGDLQIVERSLEAMALDLGRPDQDLALKDPSTPVSQLVDTAQYPAIQYSCIYWIDHFCGMSQDDQTVDLYGKIYAFLETHLLDWLFAVCLLRSLARGLESIRKLSVLLETTQPESDLSRLVQDMDRFVRLSMDGFEHYPLQIYSSALLFSPHGSITRGLFKLREPHYVTKPVMEQQWDACVQTFANSGTNIVFNLVKNQFASSKSSTIRLTDLSSGSCTHQLEAAEHIDSLAYSKDGKLLACGTKLGVLCWDLSTGRTQSTISWQEKLGEIRHIEFSPTGATLAVGSTIYSRTDRSCFVSVFVVHDGTHIGTIKYKGRMAPFKYSPNGECIVTFSPRVQIWNVKAAEGNFAMDRRVSSLDISSDGKRVAIVNAETRLLEFWSCETKLPKIEREVPNQNERKLMLDLPSYHSVVFSPDGGRFAAAFTPSNAPFTDFIHFGRTCDGEILQTLSGLSAIICLLSFSPDGGQLGSASIDGTVKLWNVHTSANGDTSKAGHRHGVRHIQISPDGKWFVSGSRDSILVWDIVGTCLYALEPKASITTIAISPKSDKFSSVADARANDHTKLKVWDKATGRCLAELSGDFYRWNSICFSPDGTMIAATTYTAVKIWRIADASCLWVKERIETDDTDDTDNTDDTDDTDDRDPYIPSTMTVAFSPDGTSFATAKHFPGHEIKVWNLLDGSCTQIIKLDIDEHPDIDRPSHYINEFERRHLARARLRDFKSLDFSEDTDTLASNDTDGQTMLWNINNGTHWRTLSFPSGSGYYFTRPSFRSISLSDDGQLIVTDRATMFFPNASYDSSWSMNPRPVSLCGPGVLNNDWITWDGHNVIWVPPAYRPSSSAVSDRTVIIGCQSGQVLVFTFKPEFKPFA